MYNRYIRNDNGFYHRIPEEETHALKAPQEPPEPSDEGQTIPPKTSSPHNNQSSDGLTGFLQHFLNQLHLDHVDTGDLLLLALLFFLFREDADEELLAALGLLLIL